MQILNEWLMHHLESGGCDDLIKVAESLQSAKQVCTACLGILQEPFNSAVFHDQVNLLHFALKLSRMKRQQMSSSNDFNLFVNFQIEVAVRKEDYEYSSFTVALSTPVTILLREVKNFVIFSDEMKGLEWLKPPGGC